ncbi:MAG: signal peptidase II [Polyangiaceae bacterium]|nr:signal peptidase II [Polyangiaceae bacterium]
MARRVAKLSLFLIILLLVGCDHATKHAATVHLRSSGPVDVIPGLLDLRYAQNHDTAFSLLSRFGIQGGGLALAIMAAVVLIGLCAFWFGRRHVAERLEHVGFAFAIAGAVGNVADRLIRGYVVDFIHLRHYSVFNVADVAIVVGMGLVLLSNWRARRATPPPAPAA